MKNTDEPVVRCRGMLGCNMLGVGGRLRVRPDHETIIKMADLDPRLKVRRTEI